MSTRVNETNKLVGNKRKKKFNSINDDFDSDLSPSTHKKLKKKIKKRRTNGTHINGQSSKYLQYKNTELYTSVVANPLSLQAIPQIFKTNKIKNSFNYSPDSFLCNLITMDSFNADVSQRFNHMTLLRQNYFSEQANIENTEALNVTDNANDKLKENKKKGKKHGNVDLHSESSSLEEEEATLKHIKLYRVKDNKGLIFHMQHKSSFSFHGEIKVTILSGEVEILGYTLSHSSNKNSVDVYSPNFCTALVIETKPPKKNKPKVEMEHVLGNYLSETDVKGILAEFSSDDAVIFIEQINSIAGTVINKYFDEPLFPKDLEDISSGSQTLKCVQSVFNFKLSRKGKHIKKNPHWDNIPLGGCTVLCGGKGVGKSTLLQYYVNKLVTQGEKVLCLDFDVGQPEFTSCGCVSAVVVDEPLLGPNFTHVRDPALMVYFGDVDVTQNPSCYLECAKYVIESCKKNVEFSRMKWFVNTMGFSKGLGVHLMVTIIKLLQPNTVIQIQGPCKSNYPFFLTPTNLNSMAGFKSVPLKDVHLSHDLRIVKSYSGKNGSGKKGELSQGSLKPRQLRDLMSLSYFSKMVSSSYFNFNAVQPYLISFSQLYLGIHSLIDLNDILKAFNGNVVSLSHFEPDLEEIYSVDSEEDDYFKIVIKPKPSPCLGLGLVRGIDCKEKKFYVMTHLSLDTLNQVNCLCLGRISPPHSMFIKQETVEGRSAYTAIGTVNVIHRVKRMFHGSPTSKKKEKLT